jgi:hypothetical protein
MKHMSKSSEGLGIATPKLGVKTNLGEKQNLGYLISMFLNT